MKIVIYEYDVVRRGENGASDLLTLRENFACPSIRTFAVTSSVKFNMAAGATVYFSVSFSKPFFSFF